MGCVALSQSAALARERMRISLGKFDSMTPLGNAVFQFWITLMTVSSQSSNDRYRATNVRKAHMPNAIPVPVRSVGAKALLGTGWDCDEYARAHIHRPRFARLAPRAQIGCRQLSEPVGRPPHPNPQIKKGPQGPLLLADRVGFEPTEPLQARRISSAVPSTTR